MTYQDDFTLLAEFHDQVADCQSLCAPPEQKAESC